MAQVETFISKGASLEETQAGLKPPAYVDQKRLETASFKRLWADSVRRAYEEGKAGK